MILRDSETGLDRRMTLRQASREIGWRVLRRLDSDEGFIGALLLAVLIGAVAAFVKGGC